MQTLRLTIRQHMMPAITLIIFDATVLPAGRSGLAHLMLGTTLILLYWLVEWRGIKGTFEGCGHGAPSKLGRVAWLAGLVLCVVDTIWIHWTPFQGVFIRTAGVIVFIAGISLRWWAMRTLSRAFSYDLKVVEGQVLVRGGPYRVLRHPSYTGLLLWNLGFALWNPSLPGLIVLMSVTIREIAVRVRAEEKILETHFGDLWHGHYRATWAVVPMIW
jgi:protein-S-isoprenylcysteine O-methyltransferase Ste14